MFSSEETINYKNKIPVSICFYPVIPVDLLCAVLRLFAANFLCGLRASTVKTHEYKFIGRVSSATGSSTFSASRT
jgi:hypothetical protein